MVVALPGYGGGQDRIILRALVRQVVVFRVVWRDAVCSKVDAQERLVHCVD